jgi:transposase
MTTKTRRTFTDEFKREAVSLLAGSGRPLTQVATELGIQPSMLRAWRGHGTMTAGLVSFPARPAGGTPVLSAEQAEIRRLQKELDRAQMERDILKKAIAIFSGPPR